MKKFIAVSFVAMTMVFASCGGSKKTDNNSDSESTEDQTEYTDNSGDNLANETYTTNDDPTPEVNNKYPDWNPVGTYKMEDANGSPFTLVIKKGGSAELVNEEYAKHNASEYTPSKGSWTSDSEGYVSLDFFEGPFITIGSHEYVMAPVLTPNYFYPDLDSYNNDTDCLAVKKE